MNKHVLEVAPRKLNTNINCDIWDFKRANELDDRRVYLYGEILPLDGDDSFLRGCVDYIIYRGADY